MLLSSFKIPAGRQIKNPKKKIVKIIPLGSLNLSDKVKNSKITIDGKKVSETVSILNTFI